MIETTGPGGAETVLVNITRGLDKTRFDSKVVLTGPGWLNETLNKYEIPARIIESNRANDFRFFREIVRQIKSDKIDIIHSHLGGMNFYACGAGMFTRRPVIATYHGVISDWNSKSPKNHFKHSLIRNKAKYIVTVSEFLKKQLMNAWKFDENKMHVIYNGVDFGALNKGISGKSVREEFNIPKNSALIGMVGNIRPSKSYNVLIRAADVIFRKKPNSRLLIVGQGKGKLLEDLKALAKELKVDDKVIFTGFREDVVSILSQLDVFVLSSCTEGLSIATIEAMGMHKPVVVTRSGGPEEIVESGVTGYLVPHSNPEALAEHILKILDNPQQAKEMGERGAEAVKEKFSIEKNIAGYTQLYNNCLDKRH